MPSDLSKRGATYYFRRVVPEVLRPYFRTARGKFRTEFMESLGVKDLAPAKELARKRGVEVDQLLSEARSKLAHGVPAPGSEADLQRKRRAAAQEKYELELREADSPFILEDIELEEREPIRRALIERLRGANLTEDEKAVRDLIPAHEFASASERQARDTKFAEERRLAEREVAANYDRYLKTGQWEASYPKLMDVCEEYLLEAKCAPATVKAWRRVMLALQGFLGHDDASKVGAAHLVAWKNHLLSEREDGKLKRAPKTVRETYIAAVRAVFAWAVENEKIQVNPADRITVRVPKRQRLREPDFTPSEAHAILAASLRPQSERLSLGHARARRWVPWLCAYTGARVNEITQLRAQDVFQADGAWAIRITPEAGSQKSQTARVVPLHSHLVEQGFPNLAMSVGTGPLFYDPAKARGGLEGNPQYKKVGERLAEWVRSLGVDDPAVQPNHGWRHLFKTRAREAGLDPEAREAIPGHAPSSEGGKYGSKSIKFLSGEIEKLPRFDVAV